VLRRIKEPLSSGGGKVPRGAVRAISLQRRDSPGAGGKNLQVNIGPPDLSKMGAKEEGGKDQTPLFLERRGLREMGGKGEKEKSSNHL